MIINEHIIDYINSLERELPEYLQVLECTAKQDGVPIIRKEAGTLLRFLLTMKQPEKILEVGTAVGYSCSFLSEYMGQGCTITTIEKVPMRIAEAKKNLSLARRREDMLLLIGDAMDVLKALNRKEDGSIEEIYVPATAEEKKEIKDIDSLKAETWKSKLHGPFDFIFMDAAKGQYMNFLPEIMELLPVNGLLVTDNVLQEGSVAESKYSITRRDRTIHVRMREYLYTLTHMEELETVVLPVGDGMTLSIRKK